MEKSKKVKLEPKILRQLKKLGVGIVYLFGSQTEGTATFKSDFDIGIVFTNPKKNFQNRIKLHSKLFDIFCEVLPVTFKNEPDISFLQFTSSLLAFEATNYGKVIFEISPEFRANFEENIRKKYFDFKPYINEYFQTTLEVL